MRRILNGLCRYCGDVALLAGATAVAVGIGMIYLPAGLIASGVLTIVGAVLHNMGGGDDR